MSQSVSEEAALRILNLAIKTDPCDVAESYAESYAEYLELVTNACYPEPPTVVNRQASAPEPSEKCKAKAVEVEFCSYSPGSKAGLWVGWLVMDGITIGFLSDDGAYTDVRNVTQF